MMLDLLKRTMLTGIGMAYLTKDKVEEMARKIAQESKLSQEEGKKLVDDMIKQSEEARNNLENRIDKIVKKMLEKMDVPLRKDLEKLEKRVAALERSLHKINGVRS